jgi:uncharacterized membrane protein YdbT with pleckstrin-like domain
MPHHTIMSQATPTHLPSRTRHEPDGEVMWRSSEGQVGHAGYYLLCFLFGWLVLPLLMMMWRFVSVSMHRYEMSPQRLREVRGVISRQTEELELYRVKDIAIREPLWQRLFGRGRIVLQTSDRSTPIVVLECIESPRQVAHALRQCVEQCRAAKGVREID